MSFLNKTATIGLWEKVIGLGAEKSYIQDTGWINWDFFKSSTQDVTFEKYFADSLCRYRKINNTCIVHGTITISEMLDNPAAINLNKITTLPASIGILDREIHQICQGSNRSIWLLTVNPVTGGGCTLNASRYGGATSDWTLDFPNLTTWMPFYIEFTTK